ncbi:hypothetical protein D0865_14046 [Hortaea werneckii]|uniref:Uncharacterized protein n=1 Tax=Hortaea werneckii TaxID=91943 RepID=A0A3M7B5K0_HORWE|nr:hypothetical protein D0865_14046 [Hortaea werneckii]
MCTQQLIWCCCGHGEFLPIEKCARAAKLGYCWTVVWGDHDVVIPLQCSALTQEQRRPDHAEPNKQTSTTLAQPLVGNAIGASGGGQGVADGLETLQRPDDFAFDNPSKGLTTSSGELEDILNTELKDFDLAQDLWHYE